MCFGKTIFINDVGVAQVPHHRTADGIEVVWEYITPLTVITRTRIRHVSWNTIHVVVTPVPPSILPYIYVYV